PKLGGRGRVLPKHASCRPPPATDKFSKGAVLHELTLNATYTVATMASQRVLSRGSILCDAIPAGFPRGRAQPASHHPEIPSSGDENLCSRHKAVAGVDFPSASPRVSSPACHFDL